MNIYDFRTEAVRHSRRKSTSSAYRYTGAAQRWTSDSAALRCATLSLTQRSAATTISTVAAQRSDVWTYLQCWNPQNPAKIFARAIFGQKGLMPRTQNPIRRFSLVVTSVIIWQIHNVCNAILPEWVHEAVSRQRSKRWRHTHVITTVTSLSKPGEILSTQALVYRRHQPAIRTVRWVFKTLHNPAHYNYTLSISHRIQ